MLEKATRMSDHLEALFDGATANDMFHLFAGEQLGFGMSRDVRLFRFDDRYVLKFETRQNCYQNALEWEFWNFVKQDEWHKAWFAPCMAISGSGLVLIQRRTEQPVIAYPEKMPAYMTDFKLSNFGEMDGRIVCHDYGRLLFGSGFTRRLKKANWWREREI